MNTNDKYTIESCGSHRAFFEGKDTGIQLFKFHSDSGSVYFECHLRFEDNGNDFRIVIRNFGIPHTSLAGSTTPTVQKKFEREDVSDIENAIKNYFLNTPPKRSPFSGEKKGNLLGFEFRNGWIVIE
jgi:hypothetical protein